MKGIVNKVRENLSMRYDQLMEGKNPCHLHLAAVWPYIWIKILSFQFSHTQSLREIKLVMSSWKKGKSGRSRTHPSECSCWMTTGGQIAICRSKLSINTSEEHLESPVTESFSDGGSVCVDRWLVRSEAAAGRSDWRESEQLSVWCWQSW